MRRKIPSTAMLVAFESAARHQSFTKAAEEVALTQSALCRQIPGLAAVLGIELFLCATAALSLWLGHLRGRAAPPPS